MDSAEPKMVLYQGGRQVGRSLLRHVSLMTDTMTLSQMAAEYRAATTVPTIYIDEICRVDERDWDKLIPTVNKEWIRRIEK